ncbi:MAG: LuxR C-terminal-related transcriptional regulator [Desulfobacterales bacterium]|nr:LuxR C-terminal-related transcriptional regulator [Desulfobacterales bacterium]
MSRRTVEKHRYNIMKKLNLHRTSALVCFAMENGLVTSFRKGNTNRVEAAVE